MAIIRFGEWLPDAADLNNPGVVSVKNALPNISGYVPIGALTPITNATDTRPRAAVGVRDKDGVIRQYVADDNKIYELINTTWTDRSKSLMSKREE